MGLGPLSWPCLFINASNIMSEQTVRRSGSECLRHVSHYSFSSSLSSSPHLRPISLFQLRNMINVHLATGGFSNCQHTGPVSAMHTHTQCHTKRLWKMHTIDMQKYTPDTHTNKKKRTHIWIQYMCSRIQPPTHTRTHTQERQCSWGRCLPFLNTLIILL